MMQTITPHVASEVRAAPSDGEIRARVVRLLATILERDPETVQHAHQLRADLGMDSLNALEFLSSLSYEFEIDLAVEEAYGLTTLDEVVALVAQRIRTST